MTEVYYHQNWTDEIVIQCFLVAQAKLKTKVTRGLSRGTPFENITELS